MKYWSRVALATLALAIPAVSHADIALYENTFDTASSFRANSANFNPPPISMRFDYGTATASSTFTAAWSTNDAATNSHSGSASASWTWNTTADGAGSSDWTSDIFPSGTTNISSISFDIMVDPSSAQDVYGGYGYFQVFVRDGSYTSTDSGYNEELGNPTFNHNLGGTWEHIVIPLTGAAQTVRALTFQLYSGTDRNLNGPAKVYIDNLTLYNPGATPQPTIQISQAGNKGLRLSTTTNISSGPFARQGIRTTNTLDQLSWLGISQPVTYSVTITNYPGTNFSTFKTFLLLSEGDVTDVSPDFSQPTVLMLIIQNQSDGTALGTVTYKVNASGGDFNTPGDGQYQLFNAGSDHIHSLNAPSVLGKWSLTFPSGDDNFTLTAPNGATISTNLDAGDSENFGNPVTLYLIDQANTTNNMGQEARYSQLQVTSNSVPLLSDNFNEDSLDLTKWVISGDPTGVLVVPSNSVYQVSWNLPDAGFEAQASANLSNSNAWFSPGLALHQYGTNRLLFVPSSLVATNSQLFFRLKNP